MNFLIAWKALGTTKSVGLWRIRQKSRQQERNPGELGAGMEAEILQQEQMGAPHFAPSVMGV